MKKAKCSNSVREMVVILDNIRSAHNVGAIFRTCEGVGVAKIFLCGVTPCPVDRFGRVRKDIVKTALGAESIVVWEQAKNTLSVVKRLRRRGYFICAIEQTPRAANFQDIPERQSTAYIFGNEVEGVAKKVLDQSDLVAEIPMCGRKESLNVSVTVGIVLYCRCFGK